VPAKQMARWTKIRSKGASEGESDRDVRTRFLAPITFKQKSRSHSSADRPRKKHRSFVHRKMSHGEKNGALDALGYPLQ